jgi:hypothetical protein
MKSRLEDSPWSWIKHEFYHSWMHHSARALFSWVQSSFRKIFFLRGTQPHATSIAEKYSTIWKWMSGQICQETCLEFYIHPSNSAHKTRSRFIFHPVFVLFINYIHICFFEVIETIGKWNRKLYWFQSSYHSIFISFIYELSGTLRDMWWWL